MSTVFTMHGISTMIDVNFMTLDVRPLQTLKAEICLLGVRHESQHLGTIRWDLYRCYNHLPGATAS